MPYNWTVESLAEVRTMWEDGKTSTEIAACFGVSRNAIIGRVGKLGLFGRRTANRAKKQAALPKAAARPKCKTAKPVAVVSVDMEPAIVDLPPPVAMPAEPILTVFEHSLGRTTIMELRDYHCRWPFSCDDGVTRYCGGHASKGSWCVEHRARAISGRASFDDVAVAA